MDIGTRRTSIDSHLASLVEDSSDLISKISRLGYDENEIIEFTTVLPSAYNVDVFLGTVSRWKDIQRMYNKPLRIYGWSYNPTTEKQILELLQNSDNILLTAIPGELRGVV